MKHVAVGHSTFSCSFRLALLAVCCTRGHIVGELPNIIEHAHFSYVALVMTVDSSVKVGYLLTLVRHIFAIEDMSEAEIRTMSLKSLFNGPQRNLILCATGASGPNKEFAVISETFP